MRTIPKLATAVLLALACLGLGQVAAAQSEPRILPLDSAGGAPLEGTRWRLTHYMRGELRPVGPEVGAWITLRAGKVRGSGGCTAVTGRYGRMGGAIRFTRVRERQQPCAEQTTIVQRGLLAGLTKAASHEIISAQDSTETQLTIRDASGAERLRFGLDDAGSLTGIEWRLERFGSGDDAGVEAALDPVAVLDFTPAGRADAAARTSSGEAVGSTGCNGFVGEFFRYADVLSFGEFERTDAPCGPELATQEAAMMAVLDATSLVLDLPPDRLRLTASDDGDWLEFVSSEPLEGSTWLLAGTPGRREPTAIVTLRLEGGVVSGEGHCGPYGGRYATDGWFIAFESLSGAGDLGDAGACSERHQDSGLLSALRASVLVDRTPGGLRFVDAAGKTRIRFRPPAGP